MSERTQRAAERIAQALAVIDDLNGGRRNDWHAVGLMIGHLIASVNELLEAVEELERATDA